MTTTHVDAPQEEQAGRTGRPRWRSWRWAAAGAVALLAVGGAIGWASYATSYQPFTPGPLWGPAEHAAVVTDGVSETRVIVLGRPAAEPSSSFR